MSKQESKLVQYLKKNTSSYFLDSINIYTSLTQVTNFLWRYIRYRTRDVTRQFCPITICTSPEVNALLTNYGKLQDGSEPRKCTLEEVTSTHLLCIKFKCLLIALNYYNHVLLIDY